MKHLHHLIVSMLSSLLIGLATASDKPPEAWDDWAKWIAARHSTADGQGHGPDVGSNEWVAALSKQLGVTERDGEGPDLKSAEWRAAVEKNLAERDKRELLSSHDTIARFGWISDHRCTLRTAFCPDRCGHSGKMATFSVVKYLGHERPGPNGDPKQEVLRVIIEDDRKNARVRAEILKVIKTLKSDELVRLKWNHDYVTKDGTKSSERTIVSIEPMTPEQVEAAGKE
jgi:hypothetical protein